MTILIWCALIVGVWLVAFFWTAHKADAAERAQRKPDGPLPPTMVGIALDNAHDAVVRDNAINFGDEEVN